MADLLRDGFVVADGCAFTFLPRVVSLVGTIACQAGLCLDVEKEISVLEGRGLSAWVQTTQFTYHAWIRGASSLFRYCSAHEGHRPYPHKHIYDPFRGGRERDVVELEGEDAIPSMRDVIEEIRVWHGNHAAWLASRR